MNTTTLSTLLKKNLSYNPEEKDRFLKEARKVLRALTKEMGLESKVSLNKAGIACSGEARLQSGGLKVVISQFFGGNEVLFRDESKGVAASKNFYCLASELKDHSIQEQMKSMI